MKYDVIIAGGGISGSIAAISAARCGARTLLIEKWGFLGGMLTAAGVGPMMSFHAGDKQVIRGITGELIDRLVLKGKSPGHIIDTTTYVSTVTPFDYEGMKFELEDMLLDSKGEILYHTMVADVQTENGYINSITVCNKSGLTNLESRIYIDATGDADIAAWAGVPFTYGRSIDSKAQPMTMIIRMANVYIDEIKEYIRNNREEFPEYINDIEIIDKAPRLSAGGFGNLLKDAQRCGEINFKRERVLIFETNNPGEVIINTTRIPDHSSIDPYSASKAEIEGRKQAEELVLFLKTRIPGFKDSFVEFTGPAIGVRSSRQIKGLYTLTREDLINENRFEDVIAHGGYPVDIHSPEGQLSEDQFEEVMNESRIMKGKVYSIPYRCLVNGKINNLITVGRCISATFEAQAAIRLSPIAGAIGHCGGVAAFMAAQNRTDVKNINIKDLQKLLKGQGAYLEIG